MKHRLTFLFIGAFVLVLALIPNVSASAFDSMRDAVADALDSSGETAGYVLGFLVIVFCFMLSAFFFRGSNWKIHAIIGFVATGFCVLIGWFPTWMIILLVIGFAVLLVRMPGADE